MAEELTQSLTALAERGAPRGAVAVLEAARSDSTRDPAPWWVNRPAWVAAAAFASTIAVLGGSLALGLALRNTPRDVAAQWFSQALDEAATTSPNGWLLIPALAAVMAVTALIVRSHLVRIRKERTMATTIKETTEGTNTDQLRTIETARRNNHWLVATIVVLALGVVAMGAWVIYDQASEPQTAATSEVEALLDDYRAAWTNSDPEAFRAVTTEDYIFTSFGSKFTRNEQAGRVGMAIGFDVQLVGELVMMTDGAEFFVGAAQKITYGIGEFEGVTAFRIVQTDDGLKVAEHNWVGNL